MRQIICLPAGIESAQPRVRPQGLATVYQHTVIEGFGDHPGDSDDRWVGKGHRQLPASGEAEPRKSHDNMVGGSEWNTNDWLGRSTSQAA